MMNAERNPRSSFLIHPSSFPRRRGFTLIEALVAAAVLGVATIAVVGPIMTARQQAEAVAGATQGLALARQLLEEIASKPYADPTDGNILLGPDAPESGRDQFDNVDDYHGFTDTTSAMQMLSGRVMTGGDGMKYTRRVAVEYRTAPDGPAAAVGDFALVTVWVTPEKGQDVELSGLVTRVSLRK